MGEPAQKKSGPRGKSENRIKRGSFRPRRRRLGDPTLRGKSPDEKKIGSNWLYTTRKKKKGKTAFQIHLDVRGDLRRREGLHKKKWGKNFARQIKPRKQFTRRGRGGLLVRDRNKGKPTGGNPTPGGGKSVFWGFPEKRGACTFGGKEKKKGNMPLDRRKKNQAITVSGGWGGAEEKNVLYGEGQRRKREKGEGDLREAGHAKGERKEVKGESVLVRGKTESGVSRGKEGETFGMARSNLVKKKKERPAFPGGEK